MKKEIRTKLKERARDMAKEAAEQKSVSEAMELITFSLVTEIYGIESIFVREVYPLRDFTPLPGVPSYILGIINVRGQILPVVDLKKFFNLPEKGLGELNKILILDNGKMEFGILADVVHGTQSIESEDIRIVPPTVTGIGEEFLKGVTNKNLIILNCERLLTDKSIIVNDKVN
jgi:purine-binding chemotaxis protein CheW